MHSQLEIPVMNVTEVTGPWGGAGAGAWVTILNATMGINEYENMPNLRTKNGYYFLNPKVENLNRYPRGQLS